MLGLWLFAVVVDLATWGQPVLGYQRRPEACPACSVGGSGRALSDAFTTRPAYRPGQGRRGSARRRRSDDADLAGPLSFRDDDSPP